MGALPEERPNWATTPSVKITRRMAICGGEAFPMRMALARAYRWGARMGCSASPSRQLQYVLFARGHFVGTGPTRTAISEGKTNFVWASQIRRATARGTSREELNFLY